MRRTVLIALVTLMVAGCGDTASTTPGTGDASPGGPTLRRNPQTETEAPRPAPLPPSRTEKVENDLYEFGYAYPAKADAIPGLKALLDKRLEAAQAELAAGAKTDQAEAAKNAYPYRKHSSEVTWKVVTDLPRWLSLSADMYDYSGGAHGMSFFDGLLWDREQNMARTAADLFLSKAALSSELRQPFCAALDKERAKRRGAPVNRNSGDQFDECIDPVEHTIILGSSNGRTFDRIGVLVEPYAAGSYAEGTFDITLPVTSAMLAVVKPAYRSEFSAK